MDDYVYVCHVDTFSKPALRCLRTSVTRGVALWDPRVARSLRPAMSWRTGRCCRERVWRVVQQPHKQNVRSVAMDGFGGVMRR